jgi:hemerythrin
MSSQSNSEVPSALEWRPELQLHVLEIDQQHRELLAMAHVLQVSIEAAKPRPELQVLLSALIDFAELHFRTEEELMLANSYKGFAAHKGAHADLLEQANMVKREFSTGAIHPCHMLALFVQAWVSQHILGPDKEFFAFLASKRASEARHP